MRGSTLGGQIHALGRSGTGPRSLFVVPLLARLTGGVSQQPPPEARARAVTLE